MEGFRQLYTKVKQSSLQTFLEAGNLNEMIKQDFLHWTKAGQLGENGQFNLSGQFMRIALAACYASPFITGSVQLQNLSFRDLGCPDWGQIRNMEISF